MSAIHTTPAHPVQRQWAGGLMMFASVMLMIAGVLAIFRGVMGIAANDVAFTTRGYVFQFDLTGWGWVHLILGAVAVIVGVGLMMSPAAGWAVVCGIAVAGFVLIANFLSLPYYPFWSVVMMALSAFVIWALCVARPEGSADSYQGAARTM
jgi:hypothetical protein